MCFPSPQAPAAATYSSGAPATTAPTKTDTDVAGAAENMRRRMALSTNGFAADYKFKKRGSQTGVEPVNLQAVTLGI
jgi:hypothetical protein